jgi:hypothetical protein
MSSTQLLFLFLHLCSINDFPGPHSIQSGAVIGTVSPTSTAVKTVGKRLNPEDQRKHLQHLYQLDVFSCRGKKINSGLHLMTFRYLNL